MLKLLDVGPFSTASVSASRLKKSYSGSLNKSILLSQDKDDILQLHETGIITYTITD